MAVVSLKQLMEAGVHFGHTTRRWNPKMKPYIYAAKSGMYILDLKKTAEKLTEAYQALTEIVKDGGQVLLVGTKKQAQEVVKEAALKTSQYYVTERWLGGTLTNFKTISSRITYLKSLYKQVEDGTLEKLSKKEQINVHREIAKLEKNLLGFLEMKKLPNALFVVDPVKEQNAVKEANKLGIPVFAIVDTNCDPTNVDYVIPANDDAVRSIKLVVDVLTNAIIEGQGGEVISLYNEADDQDINLDEVMSEKKEERQEKKEKPFKKHEKPFKKEFKKEQKQEVKEEVKPEVVQEVKKEEVKPEVKEEVKVEAKKAPKIDLGSTIILKKENHSKKTTISKKEILEAKTLAELKEIAKEKELKGYSKLNKAELVEELVKL